MTLVDIIKNLKNYTDNKVPKRVLLYQGGTGEMGEHTFYYDLTPYDEVEIVAAAWNDNTLFSTRIPVGANGCLAYFGYSFDNTSSAAAFINCALRMVQTTTSSITVSNGQMLYNGRAYTNWTGRAVPKKIYGIKY